MVRQSRSGLVPAIFFAIFSPSRNFELLGKYHFRTRSRLFTLAKCCLKVFYLGLLLLPARRAQARIGKDAHGKAGAPFKLYRTMLSFFAAGWFFGVACITFFVLKLAAERRQLRKSLRLAEAEVTSLRRMPMQDAD